MSEPILTQDAVKNLMCDCMYSNEEIETMEKYTPDQEVGGAKINRDMPVGCLIVEGIVRTYVLHPDRTKANTAKVMELLKELPDNFQIGGGWSFMNMCNDKHGNQWTDFHMAMEDLVILGLATDQVEFCLPRDLWNALPGSMPYLRVKDAKKEVAHVPG